nr:MAG TPA: hypothetical protein [Caudoviricetes sp.]
MRLCAVWVFFYFVPFSFSFSSSSQPSCWSRYSP